jgi:L-ascorbate metabolism protein UlaG (beta-lactamase superfamily)
VRLTLALVVALAAPAFGQSSQTQAARPNPAPGDPPPAVKTIPAANGGPISIVRAAPASVHIFHNGLRIDVDPAAARARMPLREPDLILITDIDRDHMDVATIRRLRGPGTTVIGPPAAAEHVMYTTTLANGESKVVWGATIEAVAMANARGNRYLLTLGGTRIRVSGGAVTAR